MSKSWTSILLEAAFVTLLATAAHALHVFESADQLLYAKLSETVRAVQRVRTNASSVVVEIDQKAFDDHFNGTTPLPREPLGTIIASLINAGRPLAIDLDLSPRGKNLKLFQELYDAATTAATGAHAAAAAAPARLCDHTAIKDGADWPVEKALCHANTAENAANKLVLLVPFPVDDIDEATAKLRWMKFVCAINEQVEFASAGVPIPTGPYAVSYFTAPTTLAGTLKQDDARPFCNDVERATLAPGRLPVAVQYLHRSVALADVELPHALGSNTKWLDYRTTPDVVPLSECWLRSNPPTCAERASLNAATETALFLGGAWDSNGADEFWSPLGSIPGVRLHAIGYAAGVPENNEWLGILVEFAVSIVLIIAFHRAWTSADQRLAVFIGAEGWSITRFLMLTRFFVPLLSVLAIVIGAATLILGATAVLLSTYVWMAPAALLVSLLAKSFLEREATDYEDLLGWCLSRLPHVLIALLALFILVM